MAVTLFSWRALPLILLSVLTFTANVLSLALPDQLSTRAPISSSFVWDGCFIDNDNGARAFSSASYSSNDLTFAACSLFCQKHKFFGLEYGNECWCGDVALPKATIADPTDCSFVCAGDSSAKCGAGNRLDVYTNTAYTGRAPARLENIPYLGCFVDAYPRVLPSKVIAEPAMTGAKCAANCAGYQYFGTQYSSECFCGDELPKVSAPESECASPCAGNDSEVRGGGMRLNVYGPASIPAATSTPPTPSSVPAPTPTAVASFAYEGCYTDPNVVRVLVGKVTADTTMTLEKCAATCGSYTYFGVEYGNECYCGLELGEASEKKLETECNMACAGNEEQMCGSGNRLNLYKKPKLGVAPSSPETIGTYRYLSCWTDKVNDRSLTGDNFGSDDMTLNMCATFCAGQGTAYFGVEFSRECYCGSIIGGQSAPESECSVLCVGDGNQYCGDANRLNVYTNNDLPSSSSTEVGATTTTTLSSATGAPISSLSEGSSAQPISSSITEASSQTSSLFTTSSTIVTSTTSTTTTTTQGPSMTTITSCPATPTYNGTPVKCWAAMPSSCALLNNSLLGYANQWQMDDCVYELNAYDAPPAVQACLPMHGHWLDANTPGSFYYNCLVAAGVACNYESTCTTATYTVGQVPTPTPTVFRNDILANPGFETGDTSGWEKSYDDQRQWAESFVPGHNSATSYKASYILNTNGAAIYLKQNVLVVPGAQYKLSMSTRHENSFSGCAASLEFYPPTYNPDSTIYTSFSGMPANVWVESETTFTAPRSFGFVQLRFYCNVQQRNTLYFDNISFMRV